MLAVNLPLQPPSCASLIPLGRTNRTWKRGAGLRAANTFLAALSLLLGSSLLEMIWKFIAGAKWRCSVLSLVRHTEVPLRLQEGGGATVFWWKSQVSAHIRHNFPLHRESSRPSTAESDVCENQRQSAWQVLEVPVRSNRTMRTLRN